MTEAAKFVEEFLAHREYDAAKAHDYYMRTRELKGRKAATEVKPKGKPKRIEEDEVPEKSPSGAKIVDYDGKGSGKATYSDGSYYDGNGWHMENAKKTNPNLPRLNAAQAKLDRARAAIAKAPPEKKRALAQKVVVAQRKLNALKLGSRSRANQN